jgi:NarL family two-component system response regulator LiaR
VLSPQIAGKLL